MPSPASTTARPLPLRRRADLVIRAQQYQQRTTWTVKDPVGLNYFRLAEEEHFILLQLDGMASLEAIRERFEQRFAPQTISLSQLQHFLATLHQQGLVISQLPGQGRELHRRRGQKRRRKWLAQFTSLLAIRLRGIDPTWLLDRLYPLARWFFSPLSVVLCGLVIVAAVGLVIVQFDTFQARLPAFHQFFTPSGMLWLAAALAGTKVLHELGHGLACRHFGGHCHEMGLMFLVFTPCLYCNVSDAWMLPSKYQRSAVGAAGMVVELVLAALCTFVWWFTEPGLLNHLCLSTMFVSSVSTLAFNANPLLRYDGYYILSDLLEIPNLAQKASGLLRRKLGWLCLGLREPDDPLMPQRGRAWLMLYAVAAPLYRVVVVASILLLVHHFLKPYRLETLTAALAAMSLLGLVGWPAWRFIQFFRVPGRSGQVKRPRLLVTCGVLAAAIAAALYVPLPHRVYATLAVEPREAQRVYVEVPGRLTELYVEPGQTVEAGTKLARLENLDLDVELAELSGRRDAYLAQRASLRQRRFADRTALMQLPELDKSLAAIEEQLAEKQQQHARLELVAHRSGVVLPPPWHQAPSQPGMLRAWEGDLLASRNLGSYLQESTLICQVGRPAQMQAVAIVDQSDVELLREGQRVEVRLDQLPGSTWQSRVAEVAKVRLEASPRGLSNKAGGELPTWTDEAGVERPQFTSYQVRIPLDDAQQLLRSGLRGEAKIHVAPEPLASRLWRWLRQTFHFKL